MHDRPARATAVTFRRLRPGEHGRLAEHLLRLDPEDRRLRFGGPLSDERIRAYCARHHHHQARSLVLGGFVAGELRAAGELKPIPGTWPRAAELAVSVERPWRGQGLGTEICRRLVVRARNRLVGEIHMLCLLDNQGVQRIARRLGGALTFHPGEVEARLDPPWPDPLTATEEWLDETAATLLERPHADPAHHHPPA